MAKFLQKACIILADISSVESQKGAINIQRCSIENQKGAINIQRCSIENQKGAINIQRCSIENQKGAIAVQSQWWLVIAPFWLATSNFSKKQEESMAFVKQKYWKSMYKVNGYNLLNYPISRIKLRFENSYTVWGPIMGRVQLMGMFHSSALIVNSLIN